jgi:pimeloyl-ACP methyl ester carboxylesterase
MKLCTPVAAILAIAGGFVSPFLAQEPAVWHDPSPHSVQFIKVEGEVRLEVLDWGGAGRPLVLLTGLGNTAHIFDNFAPKLASTYHVYGITRRGYGASSAPDSGYDADRLGADVVSVLDSLKLIKPVLIGHSVAGEELSDVVSVHPDRVAGLIYLDAGYAYAFDDGKGWTIDEMLGAQKTPQPSTTGPSAADRASFSAYKGWVSRVGGFDYPEAELRQLYNPAANGAVGRARTPARIPQAIMEGHKKFTVIPAPTLAIFVTPKDHQPVLNRLDDTAARASAQTLFESLDKNDQKQSVAFENGVPSAHVVRIANASHYVFLSNEADVLTEMRAFLANLK